MLRLTKKVCFAEEMTRACLVKPRFFTERGLNKVWDSVDAKVLDSDDRVVSLRIRIRGFSRVVYATCHVLMGREGRPDEGQCRIELRGNDSYNEAYWCMCVNDEMRYFGVAHEITARAFELDEELALDLRQFGVKTCLDLQMLTERQIAEIFRPRPETDPYVLTHPDLWEYATSVTHDKLQRLQPALKKMGVELQGPRLSRSELAEMM
jgi:hypothetical protein